MANITRYDIDLLDQREIEFKIKIEILNSDGTVVDEITSIINSGSMTIDANSRIKRTFEASLIPIDKDVTEVSEKSLIWLNKDPVLYVGIKDQRSGEFVWYKQGKFVYDTANTNFDMSNNLIQISCSDYMKKLDGTKNGQIGGTLLVKIPAYEDIGGVIKYNKIRDAIVKVLTQMAGINRYFVNDVGEYKGLEEYNVNYMEHRLIEPRWDCIPYDLEFAGGINIGSIIDVFVGLYPNYDAWFNEDGIFIFDMIPSGLNEPTFMYSDDIKKLLISESTSTTLDTVRNICEVWGQSIDVDRYATTSTLNAGVYSVTLSDYTTYMTGDTIGFMCTADNNYDCMFKINSLSPVYIYDEYTDARISAGSMKAGNDYSLRYKKAIINNVLVEKFYLLGQYQVHAIDVLTDGSVIENGYTHTDGTVVDKYSREYFQLKYNCRAVHMTTIEDSPFVIQKIGEIIDVKDGEYFSNITSDSNAVGAAMRENWINCRLTESIDLTIKLCPFLFENMKIEYTRVGRIIPEEFLIKMINHDFSSGTTTINIMKYYTLYNDLVSTYGDAESYTYSQLEDIL